MEITTGNYDSLPGAIPVDILSLDCGPGEQNDYQFIFATASRTLSGLEARTTGWVFDLNLDYAGEYYIPLSPEIQGHGTVGPAVGALQPIITTIPTVYPLTLRPETPLIEHLLFQTKIHRKLNGREQRLALRKCPRLQFEMKFTDRQSWMESYLYAQAMDAMAVPFWHEPACVTTAYTAGDNHVHVATTAQSQFKAGQWACLVRVDGTADVVEVASVAADQITFNTGAPHSYPVGSEVFPVSRCWAESISVTKRLRASEYDMKLFVEPVDNDLGITPYRDGELSITDVNYGDGLTETWNRDFYRVDGGYGLISQTVILPHADKGSKLGFRTRSRAELWALRLMFYRLHGRAIAFNLASFSEDLIPNSALTAFSTALNVERCGFTEYVQGTRASIRVVLNDGTVLPRTIESSLIVSQATERLTVDAVWPYTIQAADVRRIEYLDLVRLDTDDIVIRHQNALGWASCEVPVVHVYAQLES
ncbi:MAG: hypothetical protein EHM35_03280 [Planctomycetaceae bacterium]|nr:MAG: hypothetical protein EHM35_03280 [Planctomycetaceae bacterium]